MDSSVSHAQSVLPCMQLQTHPVHHTDIHTLCTHTLHTRSGHTLTVVAGQAGQAGAPDAALALEQGVLGPASPIPTVCLLLKNMFNPAEYVFVRHVCM